MSYTTGPWHVTDDGTIGNIEDSAGNCIAQAQQVSANDRATNHATRRANARLIAAAPDLLAALRDMTPSLPPVDAPCHIGICAQSKCGYCASIMLAIAAISKAEEQS